MTRDLPDIPDEGYADWQRDLFRRTSDQKIGGLAFNEVTDPRINSMGSYLKDRYTQGNEDLQDFLSSSTERIRGISSFLPAGDQEDLSTLTPTPPTRPQAPTFPQETPEDLSTISEPAGIYPGNFPPGTPGAVQQGPPSLTGPRRPTGIDINEQLPTDIPETGPANLNPFLRGVDVAGRAIGRGVRGVGSMVTSAQNLVQPETWRGALPAAARLIGEGLYQSAGTTPGMPSASPMAPDRVQQARAMGAKPTRSVEEEIQDAVQAGTVVGDLLNVWPSGANIIQNIGAEMGIGAAESAGLIDENSIAGQLAAGAAGSIGIDNAIGLLTRHGLPATAKALERQSSGIVSPSVARRIPVPVRVAESVLNDPDKDTIIQAVTNTPGARLTDQGLYVAGARGQHPAQELQPTMRGAVHYDPLARGYVVNEPGGVDPFSREGGTQAIPRQPTLFKAPLMVDQPGVMGPAALKKLGELGQAPGVDTDRLLTSLYSAAGDTTPDRLRALYVGIGMPPEEADQITSSIWRLKSHPQGAAMASFAPPEAAAAFLARKAGYDGIVGYYKPSGPSGSTPRIGELMDIREATYPSPTGEFTLRPEFYPPVVERAAAEAGVPAGTITPPENVYASGRPEAYRSAAQLAGGAPTPKPPEFDAIGIPNNTSLYSFDLKNTHPDFPDGYYLHWDENVGAVGLIGPNHELVSHHPDVADAVQSAIDHSKAPTGWASTTTPPQPAAPPISPQGPKPSALLGAIDQAQGDMGKGWSSVPATQHADVPMPYGSSELDQYTTVKSLGGSNGARLVNDPFWGNQFVVKTHADGMQLRDEGISDRIYTELGIAVPESRIFKGADGKWHKVSGYLGDEAVEFGSLPKAQQEALYPAIRKGFAADVLLANWDVVGLVGDNILVHDGIPYRVDNGGTLRYRAQGAPKAEKFNDIPSEVWTLRDPSINPKTAPIYKDITGEEFVAQVYDLLDRRDQILEAASHAPKGKQLAATLDERLAHLQFMAEQINQYSYDLDDIAKQFQKTKDWPQSYTPISALGPLPQTPSGLPSGASAIAGLPVEEWGRMGEMAAQAGTFGLATQAQQEQDPEKRALMEAAAMGLGMFGGVGTEGALGARRRGRMRGGVQQLKALTGTAENMMRQLQERNVAPEAKALLPKGRPGREAKRAESLVNRIASAVPEEVRGDVATSIRQSIQDINAGAFERGVVKDPEVAAAAQTYAANMPGIESWIKESEGGKLFNATETRALANTMVSITSESVVAEQRVQRLERAVLENPAVQAQLDVARGIVDRNAKQQAALAAIFEGQRAEWGRTGRALRGPYEELAGTPEWMRGVPGVSGASGLAPELLNPSHGIAYIASKTAPAQSATLIPEYRRLVAMGGDPVAMANFWSKVQHPPVGVGDWVRAIRYNSMLSGPRGIEVDMVGNSLEIPWKMLGDFAIDAAMGTVTRDPKYLAKSKAEWEGIWRGVARGRAAFNQAMRYGISEQSAIRRELPQGLSNRIDPALAQRFPGVAAVGQKAAWGLDQPSRLKLAIDDFTRATAVEMSAGRRAAITATNQGLTPGTRAFDLRVERLRARFPSSSKHINAMWDEALQEGDRMAFRGTMGTIGRATGAASQIPVIGPIALPFVRTLYHLAARGVDRSPLGAVGTIADVAQGKYSTYRRAAQTFTTPTGLTRSVAGGKERINLWQMTVDPAKRQKALDLMKTSLSGTTEMKVGMTSTRLGTTAQIHEAPILDLGMRPLGERLRDNFQGSLGFIAMLGIAEGGGITGSGPQEKEQRDLLIAQGWRPNSVWFPFFGFVGYENWGPMAIPIAAAGEIHDLKTYGSPKGDTGDLIADATRRSLGVLSRQTYLEQLSDFASAFTDDSPQLDQFQRFAAKLGTTLMPYAQTGRTAGQLFDWTERQRPRAKGFPEAFTTELGGQFQEINPLGRRALQPKTSILGEEPPNRYAGAKSLVPGGVTPWKENRTAQEFFRLQQAGNNIEIPRITDTYAGSPQSTAQQDLIKRTTMDNVQRAVEREVGGQVYRTADDATKARILNRTINMAQQISDISLGDKVARSAENKVEKEYDELPHYEGMKGSPENIRRQNYEIARAKSMLSDLKASNRGDADLAYRQLRGIDPEMARLTQYIERYPEDLAVRRKRIEQKYGVTSVTPPAVVAAGRPLR